MWNFTFYGGGSSIGVVKWPELEKKIDFFLWGVKGHLFFCGGRGMASYLKPFFILVEVF